MKRLEVYFDFLCPYCYEGHKNLMSLLEKHRDVEIVWKPCEANPRPEVANMHSDLATAGFFYLEDIGGNTDIYVELLYSNYFDHGQRLDDVFVLTRLAEMCGADADAFEEAVVSETYAAKVRAANEYAWNVLGWSAVPSYVCGGKGIGSEPGEMITLDQLEAFLCEA